MGSDEKAAIISDEEKKTVQNIWSIVVKGDVQMTGIEMYM